MFVRAAKYSFVVLLFFISRAFAQSTSIDERASTTQETTSVADSIWKNYSLDELVEFKKYYDQQTEKLLSDTERLRQRGIQDMEAFIKGHPNSPILDKIMVRLAHLYYQEAVQEYNNANDEYSEQLSLYDEGKIQKLPEEPSRDYSRSLSLYDQLIEKFPDSALRDDAIYNKGFLLEDLGKLEEAFKTFDELIASYPSSEYVPIAYMRMAEYYFNPPVDNVEKAIGLYKKVLQYKESPKYDAALYRLGWAHYKINDYPSAISYFTILADDIAHAQKLDPEDKYHFPAVQDEAIEYIGISFLDFGGAERAAEYFKNIGGRDYGFQVLKKIGDAYMDVKEEYENAIETFQTLLAMYPDSPEAPRIQARIAEGYRQLEDERMAYLRRAELFQKYKSDSDWWKSIDDPVARKEANRLAERAMRDNINLLLEHAEATKDRNLYFQAVNDSREYLTTFPEDSNAAAIHWNMALTLDTKLNMRDQAFDEYIKISNLYWDSRFQKLAAENAIAIADESVQSDSLSSGGKTTPRTLGEMRESMGSADSLKEAPNLKKQKLTPDEKQLAYALDNYIKLFPHEPGTAKILSKAGALYYQRYRFKESLKYFKTLTKHFPESPEADYSRYIAMESYFGKGDYESTEIMARKLRDTGSQYANNANKRLSEAIFLQAKTFADSLDHMRAAEEYQRIVAEVPSSDFADLALYNAALEYEEAKEYGRAVDSYTQLINNYRSSELYEKALNNLAFDYRELGDHYNAGLTYEKLADAQKDEKEAETALYNASVSFIEAEKWSRTIRVNNKFVDRFPNSEDADELLFNNAQYYLKLNDIRSANDVYADFAKRFPNSPRVVEGFYHRGMYFKENNRFEQAKQEFDKAVTRNEKLKAKDKESNDFYAAEALFQLAEIEFDEFRRIKFKLPPQNIAANKKRKKSLLLELVDNYTKTASYGTFRLYQATYRIGHAYEEFADTWAEQEIPQMDENQRILKEKKIKNAAAELYERAVESYKSGAKALVRFADTYKKSLESDTLEVQESKLAVRDTTLALADRWIDNCKSKISENVYKIAETKLASAKRLLASDPPAGIQKLEELVYRNQLLVKAIKPILEEAINAHMRNLTEGRDLQHDNHWIELSKKQIVKVSNIIPNEFRTLGLEALQAYEATVKPYQRLINNQDETAFDLSDQMANLLDLSKSFALAAAKVYRDNIESFRSAEIQNQEAEETAENLLKYNYEFFVR
ncbi:tetratricopeptide repeat protein, partial [candidate division KSB1 bacterium]|nr:tetratricopeptide repeat protein [candidate division KSB1 bacterium]NIR72733.1 tetratricopeptide repeat protein [candidate division KSB1 bacterium]NIT73615.1 tetratricopeptide repeat protein [candidate division KSB1 bacterium]NIU27488.1 tetratricopeptide repeat protein [candidate division KSB1 bacterium]NIU94030.1 tetratricopeptide repeat protein [candidate division KSB1 bacterium]